MLVKPTWLERARETAKFHKSRKLSIEDWSIAKTAKALRRSAGSISEDLLIAKWLKTHEEKLCSFENAYEALAFIRKRQRELDLELDE